MQHTLLIGFGNVDRQDDGVAWHVLYRLAKKLNRPVQSDSELDLDIEGSEPRFIYTLQLIPELSETISEFERVCFIDAHTGRISDDFSFIQLESGFQNSPFTHHLTPETLMSLTSALYQKSPAAYLATIRGYEFNFSRQLSARTDQLADQAVMHLHKWLFE